MALEVSSLSASETDGIVEIGVEVSLIAGSEIDLVIPLFTRVDSCKFSWNYHVHEVP